MSYSVHRRVTWTEPGRPAHVGDTTVEFRRHPSGVWMHMSRFRGGADVPDQERFSTWRFGQGRMLTREPKQSDAVICSVVANQNTEFRSFAFNQVLGVYVLEDGPMMPVDRWVEEAASTPQRKVICSTADYKGAPAVSVSVKDDARTRTFWVDPARDWMTVGTDYYSGTPGNKTNWASTEVTRADRVDGVWLPLAATTHEGTNVSAGTSRIEYTVVTASVGKVKGADLEVVFPPGAIVSDSVNHTRYRIEPDGNHTPAPRRK
jgi:hypothetical protein